MADKIQIELLEDGTISIQTDAVSGKNHHSADEFLDMIESLAGGTRTTKSRGKHNHNHNHVHHGAGGHHHH